MERKQPSIIVDLRAKSSPAGLWWSTCAAFVGLLMISTWGWAQGPSAGAPAPRRAAPVVRQPQFQPEGLSTPVGQVIVKGQRQVREARIRSYLQTRVGRVFDPEVVQADVHRLTSSGLFKDVRTYTTETAEGIAVTFEVFERPTIAYIKVVGNTLYSDEYLAEKANLKIGDALNIYSVDSAATKIQDFYRSKGHSRARVAVIEGNQPQQQGVVLAVHEGPKERIWDVQFVGNEVVDAGRLETLISSRPGYFKYLMRGQVNRKAIDEDVQKLTAYYRRLGYFHARIGREVVFNPTGEWATLTFVIDEGPRYNVRNVRFVGNQNFSEEELRAELQLKDGEPYNMGKMNADLRAIRDLYGSQGYIFADIQADPRFFEEPGELELIYNILEKDQYRVGDIRVQIQGANPHTKREVVLNRLGFAPGDILDSRKIRNAERRLKYSQLFRNDPTRGITPQVVVRPPEDDGDADLFARSVSPSGDSFRGQSPDEDLNYWSTIEAGDSSYYDRPNSSMNDWQSPSRTSTNDIRPAANHFPPPPNHKPQP